MSSIIRKISIGSDYKNDAMHYALGQSVYGGHEISHILYDESKNSYSIHIKKDNEILPWKKFNSNMAISIEYDIKYAISRRDAATAFASVISVGTAICIFLREMLDNVLVISNKFPNILLFFLVAGK